MNLFLLDLERDKSAQAYCDEHVGKILIEIVQMLFTAHWLLQPAGGPWVHDAKQAHPLGKEPYRATHKGHPWTRWIAASSSHYRWAVGMAEELAKEFRFRRNKTHASSLWLPWLRSHMPPCTTPSPAEVPIGDVTPSVFPVCTPDMQERDGVPHGAAVAAYRHAYCEHKARFATWKWGRASPKWMVFKPSKISA